jgi:hypothetical protein
MTVHRPPYIEKYERNKAVIEQYDCMIIQAPKYHPILFLTLLNTTLYLNLIYTAHRSTFHPVDGSCLYLQSDISFSTYSTGRHLDSFIHHLETILQYSDTKVFEYTSVFCPSFRLAETLALG